MNLPRTGSGGSHRVVTGGMIEVNACVEADSSSRSSQPTCDKRNNIIGVSLQFVKAFAQRVPETCTTEQVVRQAILPATLTSRERYADILPPSEVGVPSVYVVHCWQASFVQLVQTLEEHLCVEKKQQAGDVYIWIDMFCLQQHFEAFESREDQLAIFKAAMAHCSKLLVCLDARLAVPSRLWCLYEILLANELGLLSKLSVLVHKSTTAVHPVPVVVNVCEACCTEDSDQELLLSQFERAGGVDWANLTITNTLVQSMTLGAVLRAKELSDCPGTMVKDLFSRYPVVLASFGFKSAAESLSAALSKLEHEWGSRSKSMHVAGAALLAESSSTVASSNAVGEGCEASPGADNTGVPVLYRKNNKTNGGTGSHLSWEDLQSRFDMGLKEAAADLGICATTLKRACRRHGVRRWPKRQVQQLRKALNQVGAQGLTPSLLNCLSPSGESAVTPATAAIVAVASASSTSSLAQAPLNVRTTASEVSDTNSMDLGESGHNDNMALSESGRVEANTVAPVCAVAADNSLLQAMERVSSLLPALKQEAAAASWIGAAPANKKPPSPHCYWVTQPSRPELNMCNRNMNTDSVLGRGWSDWSALTAITSETESEAMANLALNSLELLEAQYQFAYSFRDPSLMQQNAELNYRLTQLCAQQPWLLGWNPGDVFSFDCERTCSTLDTWGPLGYDGFS